MMSKFTALKKGWEGVGAQAARDGKALSDVLRNDAVPGAWIVNTLIRDGYNHERGRMDRAARKKARVSA
jgi:hypothetical protein